MGARTGFLTISEAIRQGTKLLEDAHVPSPRLTAEVLLSHALNKERVYLYGHTTDELTELAWIHFGRYLSQRLAGKPTQYVTGRQEFYGRDFAVSPAVLIPRPETEHLVAAALDHLRPGSKVIDVGCGSGAIAVTLALESQAEVWASDISHDALAVARKNAFSHRADVQFLQADLLAPVASRSLEVIVSNPPYLALHERASLEAEVREHEPDLALFGGETGTEIYAQLIEQAAMVLRTGGVLLLELGWQSLERVRAMLGGRWCDVQTIDDLAGIPRVLTARLSS